MTLFRVLSVVAVCLMATTAAQAARIDFLYTTLDASGTIDGDIFGTPTVTIRATGDTDDRVNFGNGFAIQHTSAIIDIEGYGTFDILSPTRTFVNNVTEVIGFSRSTGGGTGGSDLLNADRGIAGAATWDMLSAIGPLGSDFRYLQWGLSPVNTDRGVLAFNDGMVPGTFQAITAPIPLPAAGWLLLAGFGGLTALRRRRKAA